MAKLFINYRRDDSGPYVDRLQDHLEQLFKEGEVFRDVFSIVPGENFKEAIETGIKEYDYVLVVIGPSWVSELKKRGAKDAIDYVRLEIETALRLDKKVIPVLVGGAQFPKKNDLPKALKSLLDKQSFEISDRHFKEDVTRLVDEMGGGWGLFDLVFHFPFSWDFTSNKLLLTVRLSGENLDENWLANSKGKVLKITDEKLKKSILTIQKRFGAGRTYEQDNRSWLPANTISSFRNKRLKPGKYKLTVGLAFDHQRDQKRTWWHPKFGLTKTLQTSFPTKSRSFEVLIGGTYRYFAKIYIESIPMGTESFAPKKNLYRIELEEL